MKKKSLKSLDSILDEEKILLETISRKSKELEDIHQRINNEYQPLKEKCMTEIDFSKQQLEDYYLKAVPILIKEALYIMKTIKDTPFELIILKEDEGVFEGTQNYSIYSILKGSDGTLVYTPKTDNYRDGIIVHYQFREIITLDKILTRIKPESKKILYKTLKKFVIKWKGPTP